MIQRVTTNETEWQRITTSGTSSGTTSDEWNRVATIENEWYNERQGVTTNDNEWQWITTSDKK